MSTFQLRNQKRAIPAQEMKLKGSKERVVASSGTEINGWDRQDLARNLLNLANSIQSGEISRQETFRSSQQVTAAERRSELVRSYNDRNGRSWSELGAAISGQVSEAADRDGFMRRLLLKTPIGQGEEPRIRVRMKNVTAIEAVSPSEYRPSIIRDRYIRPNEFYIKSNSRIEERELSQGPADIMEEKFFDTQEQFMVKEDRIWKAMADATIGSDNQLQYLSGGLTPSNLAGLQQLIERWHINARTLLIANDVLIDIVGSTSFSSWFDPVSQLEVVMTGKIGNIIGMSVITDAYRQPFLKVLNAGEVYVVSSPETHGAFTDRGPVNSKEVDNYRDGVPARGWSFWELISMVIHQGRSVVKGVRV